MHIGIDARLYGLKHAGIGRYVQNLISELSLIDTQNQYSLIISEDTQVNPKPKHCTLIQTDIKHYTLAEQIKLPRLLHQLPVDLFHFPHFNVPVFYQKTYVLTVHDLLWHDKIGFNVTTLPAYKYLIKYVGYRWVISHAIRRAQHVITPTQVVRDAVSQRFNKDPKNISVTYEAADDIFYQAVKPSSKVLNSYQIKPPFVIYTGSLYPHKNVISLVRSLHHLDQVSLVIASARNVFTTRFEQQVKDEGLSERVHLLGFVPDADLVQLYQYATALILPSQSEGFGLTGLEALAAGLPVICSDNPVLKEIYKDAAIYVDTNMSVAVSNKIQSLLTKKNNRAKLSQRSKQVAKQYSWRKMAEQTLDLYLDSRV